MTEQILRYVEDWELDVDGERLAITHDGLRQCPTPLLSAICLAITHDLLGESDA